MKRILILMVIACIGFSTYAQQKNNFTLKGYITGQQNGFLYLYYKNQDGKQINDSCQVNQGAFSFTGKISEPTIAFFHGKLKSRSSDDPNSTTIFLEPSQMSVKVNNGAFEQLVVKGSKSHTEYKELADKKMLIRKEMQPFVNAYQNEKDKEKAAEIREKFSPFNERMNNIDYAFIKAHPDSYVGAYQMRFHVSSLTLKELKEFYNGFTPAVKHSSYGKDLKEELVKLESGSPGSIAKDFAKTDINGNQLSLADFKGKQYVLLDFWASWCVPCRKGNPHLLELYNRYKDKGLEVIGISDDDRNHDAWKKAVEKDGIGVWKHVLRGLDMQKRMRNESNPDDVSEKYGIHSLPTKILIDKNGVIIGRYGGGGGTDEDLNKKLAEVLK